ncbi:hypothetical protein KKG72_00590 [bacterium]|nr:hypothetical protein [bacterium]
MKFYTLIFYIAVSFFLTGCGEESEEGSETAAASGWHFQGRDCLACHNVDLNTQKNLLLGGTLFKNVGVTDNDDLSQSCGGDFVVEFLDASYATQISSNDFEDLNSKGYQGKGNIFMLSRMLNSLNADYYIRIKDRNTSLTIAQSTTLHSFSAQDYNSNNSTDVSNRNACNACHQKVGQSGAAGPMYANINSNSCQ